MSIGARARTASVAVALLVTALLGAPALAGVSGSAVDGVDGITAFGQETPKPTKKRPRSTDERPPPTSSLRPLPLPTEPTLATGATASSGPGPEAIGFGALAAGLVGLGFIRLLGRRRRGDSLEPDRRAAVVAGAAPVAAAGGWRNLSLDDDDRLPSLLRSKPQAGEMHTAEWLPAAQAIEAPVPEAPPAEEYAADWRPAAWPIQTPVPEAQPRLPARSPWTFREPVGATAMRLAVGYATVELLDEPNEGTGRAVAELVAGDEVEILELEGAWVSVVTPLGLSGWIPSAALGVA
jgi:hypothetical protein